MKMSQSLIKPMPLEQRLAAVIGKTGSFLLAASAACALTMNVAFYDAFPSTRLVIVLLVMLLIHILWNPRIVFCRETALYTAFVVYMFVQLLWTEDGLLALNTLVPAVNFAIVLVLFGSLVTFHDLQVVLAGILGGVLAGTLAYTGIMGFPFVYPLDFSYNAMALLYFFGLFVTLLISCFRRSKWWLLVLGLAFASLILATTSIKTNLGILLGAVSAFIMYFGFFSRALARNLVLLIVLFSFLGFAVASNDSLVESFRTGVDRIALGIDILEAREDIAGYSGFERRSTWAVEGLKGWTQNPVFGYGVEAFRSRFGTTSHSTPVDLLFNSGLIGFILFYSVLLSIFWRLRSVRDASLTPICSIIFACLVCFLFITMSATMHYHYFLAAYIAISVGVLRRYRATGPLLTADTEARP